MAMNKYMHPRNIYKTPRDFTDLAVEFPEFRNVSRMDLNGKVKIDFNDQKTLRTLTKCLLLKDFGLEVNIPDDKLIPTLPLRLNYILWIEDILECCQIRKDIIGIDIGCGASCIYPLLAVKKNNWKMYGLEIDDKSYEIARENIEKNNLTEKIIVHHQKSTTEILTDLFSTKNLEEQFTFCMCNPPFFSSLNDLNYNNKKNNRTGKRKLSKNNCLTGNLNELIVDGGEIEFIKKIINESILLKNKINIYTTMLGHKNSVKILINYFHKHNIRNFIKTEFYQGKTTRFSIAWTFSENFNLKNTLDLSKKIKDIKETGHSINFIIPNIECTESIENVGNYLKEILHKLNMTIKILETSENIVTWEIIAESNTWSHQRRKRREIMKKPILENNINLKIEQKFVNEEKSISNEKEEYNAKKIKLELVSEKEIFLVAGISIQKTNNNNNEQIEIIIGYLFGVGGKDAVHQIMQFIINNWKKK